MTQGLLSLSASCTASSLAHVRENLHFQLGVENNYVFLPGLALAFVCMSSLARSPDEVGCVTSIFFSICTQIHSHRLVPELGLL
jgi:uncharacterized membrane protein YdcZ (DUF606 family)